MQHSDEDLIGIVSDFFDMAAKSKMDLAPLMQEVIRRHRAHCGEGCEHFPVDSMGIWEPQVVTHPMAEAIAEWAKMASRSRVGGVT
jgi:hypothetical protein